jgi:hypothetical protein
MIRSTSSQPRVTVKRRGSKRHAAEAEDWAGTEAPRQDREDRDDPSLHPARHSTARVLAQ